MNEGDYGRQPTQHGQSPRSSITVGGGDGQNWESSGAVGGQFYNSSQPPQHSMQYPQPVRAGGPMATSPQQAVDMTGRQQPSQVHRKSLPAGTGTDWNSSSAGRQQQDEATHMHHRDEERMSRRVFMPAEPADNENGIQSGEDHVRFSGRQDHAPQNNQNHGNVGAGGGSAGGGNTGGAGGENIRGAGGENIGENIGGADEVHQAKRTALITVARPAREFMGEHASYHQSIPGEEAEQRLKKSGKPCCYLTRYSKEKKCYVLSVYKKHRPEDVMIHFKIEFENGRRYKISGTDVEFENIGGLLGHYQEHRIDPALPNIGTSYTEQAYTEEQAREEQVHEEQARIEEQARNEQQARNNRGSICIVM